MTLRSCSRCGGTLTDVFRFCPACGDDANETRETIVDHGWPVREEEQDPSWLTDPRWDLAATNAQKASLSFPVVERPRRTRPERRRPTITLRASAGKLRQRVPAIPRPPLRRVAVGTRRFLAACGDLARLLFELVLVGAGSARDGVRSTVLLRKLHAQRAAVIYTSGCAALKGDERGVAHARAELMMLDELITAAATQTTLPFTPQRTQ
jgi:hypothetical protein